MEYKKKSKNFKNKIILGLAFVLFITTFMYSSCIDVVWDNYEAVESFSGNREHFDKIAEIVLEHSRKNKCYQYEVNIFGLYAFCEDSINAKKQEVEVPLSENDIKSLDIVNETYGLGSILVREYGIEFYHENACSIIYIYKDINVNDINSDFIKDSSDYLAFKKIEGNWYNVLPKSCF